MASANPDLAGEPGHCCLCGAKDARCLCRDCRERYSVDGVLAEQVRDMQRDAQRETDRLRRGGITFERLGADW